MNESGEGPKPSETSRPELGHREITSLLSKTVTEPECRNFMSSFTDAPGKKLLFGINSQGLLVGVKEDQEEGEEMPEFPGHKLKRNVFRAWLMDLNESPENSSDRTLQGARLSSTTRMRDGGTTLFPAKQDREEFRRFNSLTPEEFEQSLKDLPPERAAELRFYRATGGFVYYPEQKGLPSRINKGEFFPLELPKHAQTTIGLD